MKWPFRARKINLAQRLWLEAYRNPAQYSSVIAIGVGKAEGVKFERIRLTTYLPARVLKIQLVDLLEYVDQLVQAEAGRPG